MSERLDWVKDNIPLITRVAKEPVDNLSDWEAADEPWQFLSSCDEYYHCVSLRDRHTTGLCVATDATCSGLQILALLAKDKKTATLVNVVASDRPQDAYAVVAEKSKPNIPENLREHWDRKCCKRVVMTIPYNAKPFSNRTYIRDALKDKGIEIDKDDLTITVQAVRDAMLDVVPGPMNVMKWIESEVSKAISRGITELKWVTPSGFVVSQKIMKKNVVRLKLQLLGDCELRVATEDSNEVDRQRHKAATAPNLIHSLDASLLHLSATRFKAPIALIHDSVLCRATDMSILSSLVRETYMDIAKQDYLTGFASQIGAESEPPIIGDLESESVIESTYFFC
jgi:DNA-directed RNA polymerase